MEMLAFLCFQLCHAEDLPWLYTEGRCWAHEEKEFEWGNLEEGEWVSVEMKAQVSVTGEEVMN